MLEIDKNKTCCFTGYRNMKCPWGSNEKDKRCLDSMEKVRTSVQFLIENRNYENFIVGMAEGFDLRCAELLIALRDSVYPNIKVYGAIPCKNQAMLWNKTLQDRYKVVFHKLNGFRCIYDEYIGSECMLERNRYMVDNSSYIIALYDGKTGGTKYTVDYAKKQGIEVEIINP